MGISTLLRCTFYSTKKSRTAFAANNKSANLKPHGLALRAAPRGVTSLVHLRAKARGIPTRGLKIKPLPITAAEAIFIQKPIPC
ncbi:MAG TPA: hypothetical protein DCX22_03035 [Dehalococcoidia bacterium]|jgi:hypothetical protein|nr:hypothetical protein [Dehalococcoidia bacterium]